MTQPQRPSPICRTGVFAVLALAVGLAAAPHPAMAQVPAETAADQITLSGVVVDTEDDNRFFMRTGGTARSDVTFDGVTAGADYTLVAQLFNIGTGKLTGDPVFVALTPKGASGSASITLPVPANRSRYNIDYAVYQTLYKGKVDAATVVDAASVAQIRDITGADHVIQVHAIQRVKVLASDAADGDQLLPGTGGVIRAKVEYENLVAGYPYTLWGELLKPSGQSTGIYASIADYVPDAKNGSATLDFAVPDGLEGIQLVPSVGLYHKTRVSLTDKGGLVALPDAPNPVMIASDPNLDRPEKTINIGTLFEEDSDG